MGDPANLSNFQMNQFISPWALELSLRSCATCLAGHQQSYNTCWRPGGTTGTPSATTERRSSFGLCCQAPPPERLCFQNLRDFLDGMRSALLEPVKLHDHHDLTRSTISAPFCPHSPNFSNMEPAIAIASPIQIIRKELVRHALEEAELESPDVSSSMFSCFHRTARDTAQPEFSVKLDETSPREGNLWKLRGKWDEMGCFGCVET